METSPLRRTKNVVQPQRLPYHKKEHSQTTIDLYLKPISKNRHGQNDIRTYFPPVVKIDVNPYSEITKSSSPASTRGTSEPIHGHGATGCQTSDPSPSAKLPLEKVKQIPDSLEPGEEVPGIPVRPGSHKHANSAVLPRFDPLFDTKDFRHSRSPMAPRVTDVVRRSLVPKPLNIRLPPPPPPAQNSPSPSETTSSPSTVAESDTVSLDEGREASSFKKTYSRVHSRQNTNEDPISPLITLRDSSVGSWRKRVGRPAALRSNTVPLMEGPGCRDSVIYFLPTISPTEDGSGDEGIDMESCGYPRVDDKDEGERLDVRYENISPVHSEMKKVEMKQKDKIISPGMTTPLPIDDRGL